jgi:hypothetical protein
VFIKFDEPISSLTINDLGYIFLTHTKDKYLIIEEQNPTTAAWTEIYDMSGTLGTYEIATEKITLKLKTASKYK